MGLPALRQHELCSGLTTEQEKQTLNAKGKRCHARKGKPESTEVNVCGR